MSKNQPSLSFGDYNMLVQGSTLHQWGLKYEIFSQAKKRKNHLPRPTAASG